MVTADTSSFTRCLLAEGGSRALLGAVVVAAPPWPLPVMLTASVTASMLCTPLDSTLAEGTNRLDSNVGVH